jgi:hypothetical protein
MVTKRWRIRGYSFTYFKDGDLLLGKMVTIMCVKKVLKKFNYKLGITRITQSSLFVITDLAGVAFCFCLGKKTAPSFFILRNLLS